MWMSTYSSSVNLLHCFQKTTIDLRKMTKVWLFLKMNVSRGNVFTSSAYNPSLLQCFSTRHLFLLIRGDVVCYITYMLNNNKSVSFTEFNLKNKCLYNVIKKIIFICFSLCRVCPQALAMGMMTEYYHYIFTTLVSRKNQLHDTSTNLNPWHFCLVAWQKTDSRALLCYMLLYIIIYYKYLSGLFVVFSSLCSLESKSQTWCNPSQHQHRFYFILLFFPSSAVCVIFLFFSHLPFIAHLSYFNHFLPPPPLYSLSIYLISLHNRSQILFFIFLCCCSNLIFNWN